MATGGLNRSDTVSQASALKKLWLPFANPGCDCGKLFFLVCFYSMVQNGWGYLVFSRPDPSASWSLGPNVFVSLSLSRPPPLRFVVGNCPFEIFVTFQVLEGLLGRLTGLEEKTLQLPWFEMKGKNSRTKMDLPQNTTAWFTHDNTSVYIMHIWYIWFDIIYNNQYI